MCVFFCTYVCAPCVLYAREGQKGISHPWNWSYLWIVLESELGSLARATSDLAAEPCLQPPYVPLEIKLIFSGLSRIHYDNACPSSVYPPGPGPLTRVCNWSCDWDKVYRLQLEPPLSPLKQCQIQVKQGQWLRCLGGGREVRGEEG